MERNSNFKNLTFSDSDSLEAFKRELKRFFFSVELNDLEYSGSYFLPVKAIKITSLYYIDNAIWNLELKSVFDSNKPPSGSGDKVLKIFFHFPVSVVQCYFIYSIQFL